MTTPTQNNIPSSTAIDVRFNAEKLDEVVNSDNETYQDRFGNSRFTLKGLAVQASDFYQNIESDAGSDNVGTATGQKLTERLEGYGVTFPSALIFVTTDISVDQVNVRGFYSAEDGGAGTWLKTGNIDLTKAGTHVPKTATIYNALGVEYVLSVNSGDVVSAKSNGLKAVTNVNEDSEDFICVAEVVNGISSLVKTMRSEDDLNTFLKVVIPTENPLRQGKESFKAYSRFVMDFQQSSIYVRPSPSRKSSVTGVWMNAIERGIEDMKKISSLYSGKASYGNVTLSDFHLIGGKFYGDHSTTKSYLDCSTGTGLMVYNMENSTIEKTWFQDFAVGRQYLRTVSGSYYDNLGNVVTGTIIPEVASSASGSYEGVHESDVTSYGIRYLHLRTVSNWGRFDKCKFGTYSNWASSPDGSKFEYFIENLGAGVVFTGGVIEANTMSAGPTKGFVKDKARGASFIGMYYENATAPGWVVAKPSDSSNYRSNGLHLESLGSYYLGDSKGQPLVAFEEGFFGRYLSTGLYQRAGWETSYNYFAGPNTWSVGQPTPDYGAFPNGGYDFKYGTLGLHYSGDAPDVDSLRDTLEGNEFLSPYGLQVNSATLLVPFNSPAHQSNIVVWYKDLTGNYDPRQMSIGTSDNINTSDNSSVNLWYTNGVRLIDYGNGYKALLIPYVNPRPLDGRLVNSGAAKVKIVVSPTTPIVLKCIQAYVGGVPFFPTRIPDYVPKSQADRVWGTMNPSNTSPAAYYSQEIGGGIFKPGDIVAPFNPYNHSALKDPATYNDISSSHGSNTELKCITGGCAWGAGLAGKTINLTIASVDSTNDWTTVNVPSDSVSYVFAGMPLNITSNSTGSKTGLVNIIRRVQNADGTLTNQYVIKGSLGTVGGTLTISTDSSYTIKSNKSSSLYGTTGSFLSDNWLGTATGDLRAGFGGLSAGTRQLRFYYDGTNVSAGVGSNSSNGLYLTGLGGITLNGSLLTSTSYSFGSPTAYPANIYSQNAVTVVSDENYKTEISELTDQEIKCAIACAKIYRTFKLKSDVEKKGDGARTHVGTIAQLVIKTFVDHQLDWTKYEIVHHEIWEGEEEVLDEKGNVISEKKEPGEIYLVRYEEFNSFVNAGLSARLDQIEKSL